MERHRVQRASRERLVALLSIRTKATAGLTTKAIATPSVRERLQQQGADLVGGSPPEFRKLIESEVKTWTRIVKETKARVD